MSFPTGWDLSKSSVVPPLGARSAPDIGPAALMVSPEPDLRFLKKGLKASDIQPFFMGSLFQHPSGMSVAGPYIGAPYGVMLLESLIAKGARSILVFGWCGALTPDLSSGDLVVPKIAFCDEGTSRNYQTLDPALPVAEPHLSLTTKLLAHMNASGIQVRHSPVWTTDAIYRETREKIDWFSDKGAEIVEMECSALFSAAGFRQVQIAALLVVSDSLAGNDWDPGFRKKPFKAGRKKGLEALVGFAKDLIPSLCDAEETPTP